MNKPALATSDYCAPCKLLKKQIAELDLDVEIKDLIQHKDFFLKHGIRSVPTLITLSGEIVTGVDAILTRLKNNKPAN